MQQVCPERKSGMDEQLSALASVTSVRVSRDLAYADCYISVYSDERGKKQAFQNIQSIRGYLRKELSQRMILKRFPQIRLFYDDSFDYIEGINEILDRLKEEREADEKERGLQEQGEVSTQQRSLRSDLSMQQFQADKDWEQEFEDQFDDDDDDDDDDDKNSSAEQDQKDEYSQIDQSISKQERLVAQLELEKHKPWKRKSKK